MQNLKDLKKNLVMKPIRPQNVIRNWGDINKICNRLIDSLSPKRDMELSQKEKNKERLIITIRDIVRKYLSDYNRTRGREGKPEKKMIPMVDRFIGKLQEILEDEISSNKGISHPQVDNDPERPNSALATLLAKSESGSSRGSSPNSDPDSSRDSPLPMDQFNIPEGRGGESKERIYHIKRLVEDDEIRERRMEQRSQRLARQLAASQQDDDEKTTCSGSGCVITGGSKKKSRRKRKRKRKKKTKRKRRARGRKTRKNILTIFKEGRGIKKTPRRRGSSNYTQKHKPSPRVRSAFHKSNR